MSWPVRIVGAVFIAFSLLSAAWMKHWREVFAWGMALGAWYLACLQQSRVDDAQRRIDELEKTPKSPQGPRVVDHQPLFPHNPTTTPIRLTPEEQRQRVLVLEQMLDLEDQGKHDSPEWRILLERLDQIADRN